MIPFGISIQTVIFPLLSMVRFNKDNQENVMFIIANTAFVKAGAMPTAAMAHPIRICSTSILLIRGLIPFETITHSVRSKTLIVLSSMAQKWGQILLTVPPLLLRMNRLMNTKAISPVHFFIWQRDTYLKIKDRKSTRLNSSHQIISY